MLVVEEIIEKHLRGFLKWSSGQSHSNPFFKSHPGDVWSRARLGFCLIVFFVA